MNNNDKLRNNVYTLVYCAILTAVTIVCSRFLSVYIPNVMKLSTGFIPIALAGYLLGPVPALVVGALSDFIGAHLFPVGTYFAGYTITAGLSALFYGIFLYSDGRFKNWDILLRAIVASLLIALICHVALNTLWTSMLFGRAFFALFLARIPGQILQLPVRIVIIVFICRIAKNIRLMRR